MRQMSFAVGVLLAMAGAVLLLLVAMGVGLAPDGTDSQIVGVDARSWLTIGAGLLLACGITLVGLGFGRWQHPVPPGPSLEENPDRRRP
jgi:hypothetical protein